MKTHLLKTLESVQAVSPIGAATIFALAYVASYIGLAALLIVAAFLIGLYFAKRPIVAETTSSVVAAVVQGASVPVETLPALSNSPLADALANGLAIKEIKFAAASNGRARKQTVSAN